MNLYHLLAWREYKIRFSGQVFTMKTKAITKLVNEFSDKKLGLHALTLNTPHVFGAPITRDYINQV